MKRRGRRSLVALFCALALVLAFTASVLPRGFLASALPSSSASSLQAASQSFGTSLTDLEPSTAGNPNSGDSAPRPQVEASPGLLARADQQVQSRLADLAVGVVNQVAPAPPAASTAAAAAPGGPAPDIRTPSRLIFSDEFGGPALDSAKWSTCYPWWPEDGCTNSGNSELQWYLPEQVKTADGALHLTAEHRATSGAGRDGNPATYEYRSGMISSADRFSFTYGYVEFRARIPQGRGLWPALWLLPTDQSWPPEIDVMEALGQYPSNVSLTYHRTKTDAPQSIVRGGDFSDGWHTFAIDWKPGSITWYVDGAQQFRVEGNVASKPMYLIANLAVSGETAKRPDATTPAQASFEVDYVRVWQ